MANLDVVARLQLRAEQFSSENGRAFAELRTRAASAAQEVRQSFTSSFAEVQKVASTALQLPRTETGSLNLTGQIAELERMASEAERNAAAQQKLSVAFTAASASGKGNAEALRQNADAAAVASLAAEHEAASLREQLAGYRQVQVELNRTTGVTELHSRASNDNAVSAGQQRAAMQQLGYQLGDVATQFAAGTSPMIIFAQQGGQVVQSLQLMTNKTTGLLGFLGGPWGAVIGAAAVVVGTLATKLFDSSDAAKEKAAAAEKLSAKIDGLYESTLRQVRAEEFFRAATIASATALLFRASAERQQVQASLDARIAEARAIRARATAAQAVIGTGEGAEVRTLLAGSIDRKAREAEAAAATERQLLAEKATQERKAIEGQRAAQLVAANARVAESLDKVTAAQGRNRRAADTLSAGYIAGRITLSEYEAGKRRLDVASEKEVETLRKSGSAARGSSTAFAEASGRLAGATTEVQRAEAELARTRADLKAGRIDEVEFAARIGAATRALNEARDGAREGTKAARDAASAQRELDSTYQSIVSSLDPALAATLRYRDTLKDIAALGAAGKISESQADDYRARLIRQREEEEAKYRAQRGPEILGVEPSLVRDEDLNKLADTLFLAGEKSGRALGRTAGDELGRAVDSIAYLFGGRLTGPLAQLLQPGGIGREAKETSKALVDSIQGLGANLSSDVAQSLKSGIETAFKGAAFGGVGGSVFSAITGGKQDRTASAIGGVLGEVAGKSLSKPIGDAIGGGLGKALGSAAGPLGAIAGGIAGSLIGGLFGSKSLYGTARLTGGAAPVAIGGNDSGARGQAGGLGDSVQSGIQKIAEQLGGTVGNYLVSIGVHEGKYRVSTVGQTGDLNYGKSNKQKAYLYNFDDDEGAAIRFAIVDALKDGAVQGISDAAKRVLAAGKDLDSALNKALLIESVPKDLKAIVDPLGAAIDTLNLKFKATVDALKEGGASAEQMAQAQQLYDLQLAQVKASTESASSGLKAFLADLRGGTDSPLSLRDQEAAVRAELAPYLSAIETGQRIDQGMYQDAAKRFLDIERELYGSTDAFFAAFDAVQASTAKAIATIDNAVPIGGGVESPFAKATADSAAATAMGVQVGNDLSSDTNLLLQQAVTLLTQVAANTGAGGNGFIGAARGFAA